MDIGQFKAGNKEKQVGYSSFTPSEINKQWIISNPEIITLLSEADRLLGELNAFSQYIPDVDFFISMHVVKEATESSRIEGTQTSIEEVLLKIEDIDPEKRDDWTEVQNYIEAMNYAIIKLNELPLSGRLIRQTHKILLRGVRGKHKLPGDFRTSQNWIGGATINDAIFIPPHHNEIPRLMGDLEKFINSDELKVPHLIKIALAHYQFETIHPFLDGNGRIGRLLITLYLVSNKILLKPTLYLSEFFEKNRSLYYDNLMIVRTNGNLEQWLKFFLTGVIVTAKNSIGTLKSILELKERIEGEVILELGKRVPVAKRFIKYLYKQPVVNVAMVSKALKISVPSATSLIADFERIKILKELTGYRRNRVFMFAEYFDLFNNKT